MKKNDVRTQAPTSMNLKNMPSKNNPGTESHILFESINVKLPEFYLFCSRFIYFRERKPARAGEAEEARISDRVLCWTQSPMQGLISQRWDHNLSLNQDLDPLPTLPPRCHSRILNNHRDRIQWWLQAWREWGMKSNYLMGMGFPLGGNDNALELDVVTVA